MFELSRQPPSSHELSGIIQWNSYPLLVTFATQASFPLLLSKVCLHNHLGERCLWRFSGKHRCWNCFFKSIRLSTWKDREVSLPAAIEPSSAVSLVARAKAPWLSSFKVKSLKSWMFGRQEVIKPTTIPKKWSRFYHIRNVFLGLVNLHLIMLNTFNIEFFFFRLVTGALQTLCSTDHIFNRAKLPALTQRQVCLL